MRILISRKFTVVPSNYLADDSEGALQRKRNLVQQTENVFRSLLYESESVEEAIKDGRVVFPDAENGTIEVVDTPENLETLEDYLEGITGVKQKQVEVEVRQVELVCPQDKHDDVAEFLGVPLGVGSTNSLGMSFSVLDETITGKLSKLGKISDIRILTAPKVSCVSGATGNVVVEPLSFKVTPIVTDDGKLEIDCDAKVETVEGDPPARGMMSAKFRVQIKSSETVVAVLGKRGESIHLLFVTPRIVQPE